MKKMLKKLLCTATAAAMLFSVPTASFAEENDADVTVESQAEAQSDAVLAAAIAIAKTRLVIPESYSKFSSDASSQYGVQTYALTWEEPENDYSYSCIEISVNSKGDITEVYSSEFSNYGDSMSLPKISSDDAKSAAEAWLSAVNPSWIASLDTDGASVSEASLYSNTYVVCYERYENGVRFGDDDVTIYVDKKTGEVGSMYSSWSYPSEITSLDGLISDEAAENALIENSPLELSYRKTNSDLAVLVYMPEDDDIYINALDGTLVAPEAEYRNTLSSGSSSTSVASAEMVTEDTDAADDYSYTDEELAELEQKAGLLTSEQAVEIFRGIKYIDAEKYTLSSYSYNTGTDADGGKSYTIYLSLSYKGEENGTDTEISYMNVTLDAENGELKYLSSYSYGGEEPEEYSLETAKTVASAFAGEYAPDEYAKTKLDEEALEGISDDAIDYAPTLSYYQYENDIVYTGNSIRVRVDGNGLVTYFSKSWNDDIVFESPDGMITAEEAAAKLFEQNPAELSYKDFTSYGSVSYNFVPVYTFGSKPNRVSATSGKLLGYSNTEYTEKSRGTVSYENLTDISGHYAEEAVRTLLYYNIISLDEGVNEFRPDDVMTQTELLAFVGTLSGYDYAPSDEDYIYRIAQRRSVIKSDEIDKSAQATRTDAAKFIVRAIGFGEAAEIEGIFDCGFLDRADIPYGCEGYVAIAKGLNVVNGDENNCFNPSDPVTRGDAAIMIYNYLSR